MTNIPTLPTPEPPTGKAPRQGTMGSGLARGASISFTTIMAVSAVVRFMRDDTVTGALFAVAAFGGLMWAWAEWRAQSAYEAGLRKGSEMMRDAAVTAILDGSIHAALQPRDADTDTGDGA